MDVLVKGMELPKNCLECGFQHRLYCKRLLKRCFITSRLEDCPLVEVPPHGRLIDADALITTFCEWGVRLERGQKLTITMCEAKQAIVDIIEDAPTVIEAEE